MPKIYNAPPGFEMNPIGYAAELRALRAEVARLRDPALPTDADAAFADWVRNVPLHERTPRNVWHASAAWKGASNGKASS